MSLAFRAAHEEYLSSGPFLAVSLCISALTLICALGQQSIASAPHVCICQNGLTGCRVPLLTSAWSAMQLSGHVIKNEYYFELLLAAGQLDAPVIS